jgi:hypothetical protein
VKKWLGLVVFSCSIPAQSLLEIGSTRAALNDSVRYRPPSSRISSGTTTGGGDLFLLASGDRRLFRVDRSGTAAEIDLRQSPDSSAEKVNLVNDVQAGADGSVYVGWISRVANSTTFAVSRFSREGQFLSRTILSPPVELRRFSVGPDGSLYVAGLDGDYLLGKQSDCFLLHKYSPSGARLRSMSPCPENARLRGSGARPGPDFNMLADEITRGQVWVDGKFVFQILPDHRRIRRFTLDGESLDSIALVPPSTAEVDSRQSIIWRAARLADGRWLIDWATPLTAAVPKRPRFLAIHAPDGTPASEPAFPTGMFGLLGNGPKGEIFFTRVLGAGELALSRWDPLP